MIGRSFVRASVDTITSPFQASLLGAHIVGAAGLGIGRGRSAERLSGIKAALVAGPAVTLVTIGRLLRVALAILGIGVELGTGRCRSAGRSRVRRRCAHDVFLPLRPPQVVGAVGVVVRHSPEPYGGVEGWQETDADAEGRRHDDESRSPGAIPRSAVEVIVAAAIGHAITALGKRAKCGAAPRIVVSVVVAIVVDVAAM